jgi:hypothetical protein
MDTAENGIDASWKHLTELAQLHWGPIARLLSSGCSGIKTLLIGKLNSVIAIWLDISKGSAKPLQNS